jgi:hypothetical protein
MLLFGQLNELHVGTGGNERATAQTNRLEYAVSVHDGHVRREFVAHKIPVVGFWLSPTVYPSACDAVQLLWLSVLG